MMLIALIFTAALTVQAQTPTAHPSTWDGTAGGHTTLVDRETGEITYPLGRQPANALALGCVFGRLNVRCPRPADAAPPTSASRTGDDWRTSGTERFGVIEFANAGKPPVADRAAEAGPVDCVLGEPQEGQRACTFDEALANSYYTDRTPRAETGPAAPPADRPGCRREEYRNPDGTGGGVRLVCGSGDTRAIDALRDTLQPFPR